MKQLSHNGNDHLLAFQTIGFKPIHEGPKGEGLIRQQGLEQASVAVMCGYDLLARAVHDTLREAGFHVEVIPLGTAVIMSKPDTLVLDDAAIYLGDNAFQHIDFLTTCIILIDSTCTPQRVLQASRLGVAGYLYLGDRLAERLKGAVTDVLEGGIYYSPTAAAVLAEAEHLTDRVLPRLNAYHRAVLRGMARYQPAAQIAAELGRTTQAIYQVQSYLRSLFDVDTNGALLERAAEWGLIHRSA
jgi:DNA-binding NarL/FixJ family response regulator